MRVPILAPADTDGPNHQRSPASFSGALMGAVFFCVLHLVGTAPAGGQTILNVERLQPGEVEDWHWGVEGALSVSRGDVRYVDVLAGVVVGYRWSGDWLRAFAGLDYRDERGEGLENDRYLHVRHNHWLAECWQSFHFIQLQGSHLGLLQRRILVGSGLRTRLISGRTTFDLGTGAMYEREDLDPERVTGAHDVESRLWRMANLVVATRRLSAAVRLVGVTYVQPALADFADLRTLTDVSLLIALTDHVELAIRSEWRHDEGPPEGVDPDSFLLRTGFTFSFR